ncbi:MAG TPA: membrane integrity-associated transporter subunit PqiC [Halieaceae bacterium]|nr:membrane integrity-associated transporter subunit PqiC [Halieaceae bacterium]
MTRAGGSRVNVDEYHVWSAPLEYEFLRVLGDDIASDTQSDRIAVYPKEAAFKVDYRVTLDVLQFDGVAGDSVTLRARWAIAPATGDAIAVGSFEQTEPAHAATEADNYDALVSAHSALIGDLGRLISAKLRELVNHPEGSSAPGRYAPTAQAAR